jgi:hypothetical protein
MVIRDVSCIKPPSTLAALNSNCLSGEVQINPPDLRLFDRERNILKFELVSKPSGLLSALLAYAPWHET